MVNFIVQNNYVEHLTARVAECLRLSGKSVFDFSMVSGFDFNSIPFSLGTPNFFYGSTQMIKAVENDPYWGEFLLNRRSDLDQRLWDKHRGDDMINVVVDYMHLSDVEEFIKDLNEEDRFFIRPTMDPKAFSGKLVEKSTWKSIYEERSLPDDLWVSISPMLDIKAEYRFIVQNHAIVAGSMYVLNGKREQSASIPLSVLEKAEELAKGWMPAKTIVMDVAVTVPGEVKIIEFNSVHSSGLYAIPPEVFVAIIERIYEDPEEDVFPDSELPNDPGLKTWFKNLLKKVTQ